MRGGLRLGVAVFTAGLVLRPGAARRAKHAPGDHEHARGRFGGPQGAAEFQPLGNGHAPGGPARPAHDHYGCARPQPGRRYSRQHIEPSAANVRARRPSRNSERHRRRSAIQHNCQRAAVEAPRQTPPSSSITVALPPFGASNGRTSSAAALPAASSLTDTEGATGKLAPERGLPLWPWLLAALALGAGGAFLFWRSRSREAFAGGPQLDVFRAGARAASAAPTESTATRRRSALLEAPQSAPVPTPKRPSPAIPGGVVSTGLRPRIEIALEPLRCIVDETRVTFEFEIDLFNAGNAPARGVLVEASMFNAGPTQETDIGVFFARPDGEGERIAAIPPLQRMTLRSQVVAPRDNLQVLEIGERQVCIPLIAFNALYRWNAGEGQTSAAYLLGRDTKGEKMAPFRLDLGPRVFRAVGARLLPNEVKN